MAVTSTSLMPIKKIAKQGLTHPFGDERTVQQAFPAAIDTSDADPFLMCDYFSTVETKGPSSLSLDDDDDDDFPVDWHPHRGFDICSYLKSGTGRHGDSLGNRETYDTPGMQWMSTGSGVMHAEGGATTARGVTVAGFQIWINVPSDKKMDDPRYGTVPPKDLPIRSIATGVEARVLAGEAFGVKGPFATVQPVQMIDLELQANSKASFDVANGLDTTMLYVYEGELSALGNHNVQQDHTIASGSVVLLDASSNDARGVSMTTTGESQAKVLVFAGKKLKEPIAWHGPIVMNTQDEIRETFRELRSGQFPPVKVDWDYRRIAAFPKSKNDGL